MIKKFEMGPSKSLDRFPPDLKGFQMTISLSFFLSILTIVSHSFLLTHSHKKIGFGTG
jgi:hypothetical protein